MIGDKFVNKWGTTATVLYEESKNYVTIGLEYEKSLCPEMLIMTKKHYPSVKKGRFRGPYCKSVCGTGFIGEGDFEKLDDPCVIAIYKTWMGMMNRCYGKTSASSSYREVGVEEHWHNFQNFAVWAYAEEGNDLAGWSLDKDLFSKDFPKVYSRDTCCYLPQIINSVIYKGGRRTVKCADHLRFLVDFYDELLPERTIKALRSVVSKSRYNARRAPPAKKKEIPLDEKKISRLEKRKKEIREYIQNRHGN